MTTERDLIRRMVYALQVECRFALFRIRDAEELALLSQLHPWLLLPGEEPEKGYENWEDRLKLFKEREERTHLAVHDFLTHAANVSKIFFPVCWRVSPQRCLDRKKRGEALCEAFGIHRSREIAARSMEIASRDLRDAIEHFDERMEDVQGLDVFDLNSMPFGWSTPGYPSPGEALRSFDGKGAYTFLGQSIDLAKAREELEDILTKVRTFYDEEYTSATRKD